MIKLTLTDVVQVKSTVLIESNPDSYAAKVYKYGHPFDRLTLTLSAKGWTASVQWKGTNGARGHGSTQLEAVNNAIQYAETEWGLTVN